jgi:hypothetical protein
MLNHVRPILPPSDSTGDGDPLKERASNLFCDLRATPPGVSDPVTLPQLLDTFRSVRDLLVQNVRFWGGVSPSHNAARVRFAAATAMLALFQDGGARVETDAALRSFTSIGADREALQYLIGIVTSAVNPGTRALAAEVAQRCARRESVGLLCMLAADPDSPEKTRSVAISCLFGLGSDGWDGILALRDLLPAQLLPTDEALGTDLSMGELPLISAALCNQPSSRQLLAQYHQYCERHGDALTTSMIEEMTPEGEWVNTDPSGERKSWTSKFLRQHMEALAGVLFSFALVENLTPFDLEPVWRCGLLNRVRLPLSVAERRLATLRRIFPLQAVELYPDSDNETVTSQVRRITIMMREGALRGISAIGLKRFVFPREDFPSREAELRNDGDNDLSPQALLFETRLVESLTGDHNVAPREVLNVLNSFGIYTRDRVPVDSWERRATDEALNRFEKSVSKGPAHGAESPFRRLWKK